MTTGSAFEERVRDLPCDAKLAYVVLEKRGPFTRDELAEEVYLTDDEVVWALAVLDEEEMVEEYEHPGSGETIYEVNPK